MWSMFFFFFIKFNVNTFFININTIKIKYIVSFMIDQSKAWNLIHDMMVIKMKFMYYVYLCIYCS